MFITSEFVESVMPYRTAVGEHREVGACLMENKAEPYQWLDPIIMYQTKPDKLVRLKVVEYAIQERVVTQHTERACGTRQARCNSRACGMQQPGHVGMWDTTGGVCRMQQAGGVGHDRQGMTVGHVGHNRWGMWDSHWWHREGWWWHGESGGSEGGQTAWAARQRRWAAR